jgi:uncharacterized DUF497 family protein
MTFDWDHGNRTKCQKHGLTLDDIEHALTNNPRVAPDPAHSQDEQRFIAISRTATGRPVFVAFCWRGAKLRPISARYMHAKEAARYDQTFPQGATDEN